MKKSGLRIAILCLPLFLFLIAFFVYKPHQVYTLLPVKDTLTYNVYTYSDTVKNDAADFSTVSIQGKGKDSICFRYKLDTTNAAPFAGITFLSKTKDFFPISKYDIFEIEIQAAHARRPQILLGLTTSDSSADKRSIEKYVVRDLDLVRGKDLYQIPLKEFVTPSWWYVGQGISEKDIADVAFTRLRVINIQNCQLLARNTEDEITIKQIRFLKDVRWFYFIVCVAALIYYAFYYFLAIFRRRAQPAPAEKIEIRYTPVEMVNHSELDKDKLVAFLSSHYDNPELSLKTIQEAIGLSETKVSQLLKNTYQLTFKQYLNKLRITEAKRLLKDVDVPVSDIAYRVGYGHISHFNRVFKELEGMSPNDYRKKDSGQ